jgi:Ser/Thr protein kinase RdoA (MazF antagonist)
MSPSDPVLSAYGATRASVVPIPSLINQTFRVATAAGEPRILQRLHPVFGVEVHHDIEAVTEHLERQGLLTPRLVPTTAGTLWLEHANEVWRAQTYVVGRTVHACRDVELVHAAGACVGRFHRALADFRHEFRFTRAGVHDTRAHLDALKRAIDSLEVGYDPKLGEVVDLGKRILARAADAEVDFSRLPVRVTHGDLKISNVLFETQRPEARCLIDLDTLGYQVLAYELGDALRSWTNPREEDAADSAVDLDLFEAALRGYADGAHGFLSDDERRAIVPGLCTVSLELSARFCRDAIEDHYFGWDASRYVTRRAHNLARARGQFALAEAAFEDRAALDERVAMILTNS